MAGSASEVGQGMVWSFMMVPDLINALRRQIEDLEHQVADLTRQNEQLREAVTALLSPDKVPVDDLTRWRDR